MASARCYLLFLAAVVTLIPEVYVTPRRYKPPPPYTPEKELPPVLAVPLEEAAYHGLSHRQLQNLVARKDRAEEAMLKLIRVRYEVLATRRTEKPWHYKPPRSTTTKRPHVYDLPQLQYARSGIRFITFFYPEREANIPARIMETIESCKYAKQAYNFNCYATCVGLETDLFNHTDGIRVYKLKRLLNEINPYAEYSPNDNKYLMDISANIPNCNIKWKDVIEDENCLKLEPFWLCVRDVFADALQLVERFRTTAG